MMKEEKETKAVKEFQKTHEKSKQLWNKAKNVFPGGVSHNLRTWKLTDLGAYPFFIKDAEGCKIWDEDGNEYIDFWIGHLELLFGHTPKHVIKAIRKQAIHGTHWGIPNRKAIEFAELISESVPSIEKLRFSNSGTEATMYAIRLARAFTGKKKILKVKGGWHGANPDLTYAINYPFEKLESKGILPIHKEYCISIPFNDQERTKEILRENKDEIAGIIIEPVLGAGGGIPAEKEYLKLLRAETEELEACLIFDEVITGFRLGIGGAQEYYGVSPDLTVLGKTTGGGLPIGVVGGRREILEQANPSKRSRGERALVGGGTFSVNPMTMTAGLANLRKIRAESDKIYKELNTRGEYARKELRKILKELDLQGKVTGTHSIVMLHILEKEICEVTPKKLQKYKAEKKSAELRLRLLNRGFFEFHGMGALCTKHTKKEIDAYLTAVTRALQNLN